MTLAFDLNERSRTHSDVVNATIEGLKPHVGDFDGIISSGLSGLLIAAPVAHALGKTLGAVRHTDEKRHPKQHTSLWKIEKACFIDDFFGGGRTFRHCHQALKSRRMPNMIAQEDLDYYIRGYGEAWCKTHHPEWFVKDDTPTPEIVAVYTYDKTWAGSHYVHITGEAAVQLQSFYKLWPADQFDALHRGEKPEKSAVKRVVTRDEQGRF